MATKRERKFSFENCTPMEASRISNEVGEKAMKIMEDALAESNKLLKIYGLRMECSASVYAVDDKLTGKIKK